MRNSAISSTQERILAAAAGLFSQSGYKGTTTRHIASAANVNEVTIYRYYPRKRDLYLATLDAELQKVSLRGDLLTDIADAPDGLSALACTFRLITTTLAQKQNLVRLIQYSALELNDDFDPILRHYVGELIEVISRYLEPWVSSGQLRCDSAKSLTLTLIAIVLTHRSLSRVFSGKWSSPELMMDVYSEFCVGQDPHNSTDKKFDRG
jgi:AcrR family transcriptional regulator